MGRQGYVCATFVSFFNFAIRLLLLRYCGCRTSAWRLCLGSWAAMNGTPALWSAGGGGRWIPSPGRGWFCHRLERLCIKDLHNARLFIPLLAAAAKSLKALIVCRSSGNWDPLLESLQQGGETGSVTEIQMENVQMGDPGLVAIAAACPDLEVLYLSRASDCTEDGVSALANSCRKLRKLHIDAWSRFGSRTIGDDGVLSIATRCANLQEVVLMGIPATIGSFNVLASNCPALERMAGVHRRQIHSPEEALLLLRSKFENAVSLNRRSSSSSIHAPR